MPHIKIGKEIIKFGDTEIKKNKFHCHGRPIFFKDVESNTIFSGEKNYKYFSGYL